MNIQNLFTFNRFNFSLTFQKLMPRLETLDISNNKLQDIEHLQHLSSLVSLNLSNNNIRQLESLHTKLGNVKYLNLSSNKLESLKG